jgi:hypothetical protein
MFCPCAAAVAAPAATVCIAAAPSRHQDIAAVRDAMLDAAGNAWSGMREATVDVMQYQYGNEVASVAADSADVVEGVANMGVAMRYAQPTQVWRRTAFGLLASRHSCSAGGLQLRASRMRWVILLLYRAATAARGRWLWMRSHRGTGERGL